MRRLLGYALCAALIAGAGIAGAETPAAAPGDARSGVVRPGEVRPGEVRPGEVRPGEVRPGAVRNVAIPFVDNGGIKSWRSGGEDAILIEARSGRWYRGEFRADCPQVRASETVAFISSPAGVLDHFSSIVVSDRICRLRTLTDAPNPRLKTK